MTSNRDRIDIEKNLDKKDVFEKFIRSYSVYYDVSRKDTDDCRFEVAEGFDAEARFDSKSEQYFLVKKAKVADIHSSEYVYFSLKDNLSLDIIKELDQKAWEYAIEHAAPGPDHKNTDSVLIVICDNIEEEAKEFIIKANTARIITSPCMGIPITDWLQSSLIKDPCISISRHGYLKSSLVIF